MKKYPTKPDLSKLDSNKIEEFYKKFGLIICLYQGVEQSLVMHISLQRWKAKKVDEDFSEMSEKLKSLSFGVLLRNNKNFISKQFYDDLLKLKDRRNYFAHRYYHDQIFKIMTETDLVLEELDKEICKLQAINDSLDIERKQRMNQDIGEDKIREIVERLFE